MPDDGVPHPRADNGADSDVDGIADADCAANVDADVCVHEDGNGYVNGNTRANGYVDVYGNGNGNGNGNTGAKADTRRDPNPPTLTHPDSGRPIVCTRRRVGCAAN